MRLIKRYKNRRLYDCETSRTITQFELARMIQDEVEVRIIDSASGDDITLEVLSRVMAEQTLSWGNVREATEFVRNAIKTGGDRSMSILKNTILASIGIIQVTKKKAEEIIDDLIKRGELDKSDRKAAVMELLEKAEKSTESFRKKVVNEAEKAGKGVSKFAKEYSWATQSDMKKLNTKVNKLARMVKDLEAKMQEIHPDK